MVEPSDDLFGGGGDAGRLMAEVDWSATRLGPVRDWPQSLKAAVRIVLSSRYPMLLLWGPDLTQLYNDAYSALIGDKHPEAMGLDVRITLAEGWAVLRPLIEDAMATGVASWVPALQLLLERSGYREEAYFSVSHAPARDDQGTTVGVLTVCSEVTDQVVGQRRLRLLGDLAMSGTGGPVDVATTCAHLGEVIGRYPLDVPFAAIYLRDGAVLRRVAAVGVDAGALPATVASDEAGDWGLAGAASGETVVAGGVDERLAVTGGPWDEPVTEAVAQPLPSADHTRPAGVLLTGVSPSRALDDTYRSFLHLLAQQVSVSIRNAQAYQQERERAAALAELDRVKTDFFTNVSHEFRTPLTLMLGPLTDALADTAEPLGGTQRDRVDVAHRNAGRLLTLVNELLTFSSIGRDATAGTPQPLDLARYTTELASVFRAAIERTGLRLIVRCPPLPVPVAVDPRRWESIVTNLLSNALKFTFVGHIEVRLDAAPDAIRLTVADTGIGIDADELPRLFDRFHRVRGARARSHEGTGIGLALVRELTRLAGGDVEVRSTPGEGTAFTVVLPWDAVRVDPAAAPVVVPDRLGAARAAATVAGSWTDTDVPAAAGGAGIRVLVADDNSDMRAYLSRLLTAEGWKVQAVADGEQALQAIHLYRPHLVVTDVMMPRLDGFGLVRALRSDDATRHLPIVMLSARAGQESGVEGLAAGADDYIVKPFRAEELIAKIRNVAARAPVPAAGDTAAGVPAGDALSVIAAGRALSDAMQTVVDLTSALLEADAVVAVAGEAGPPLRFSAGREPGSGPDRPGRSTADIVAGDGTRLGELTAYRNPPAAATLPILSAAAGLLAAVAHSSGAPGTERQRTLAIQRAVLPAAPPADEDWSVQCEYRPGPDRAGGAWYDIAEAPDGDWVITVGEVAGDGLSAAVISGMLNAAVRAHLGDPPSLIMTRLAEALHRLPAPPRVTLLIVRLDPRSGRLTWCSAGHPVPFRSAAEVSAPLGAGVHTGDDAVLEHGDHLRLSSGKDTAVVTVQRRPAAAKPSAPDVAPVDVTWTYPLSPQASSAARRDIEAAMEPGADPDLLFDMQLAATEAINNAVEHAQQPTRPEVRMRLLVTASMVRIEVQDFGGWRARPAARDRGRGALFMNAYGDVQVLSNADGTLVSIERAWKAAPGS
ncbi:ATP-binding protein [Actinoplanes sp. NPDC023714]|uniref:ATP-binding protein n=1 Tax=Actinoplanes sp. NPDC023714 TaxID=3154322 RepID=UPI0033FD9713